LKNQEDQAFYIMAERTRLELATSGLTGRRSNRLNYRSPKLENFKISRISGLNLGVAGFEPATTCV
jgi:hypothetical protein